MQQIAIFGFGTVGSGVAQVIDVNCSQIEKAFPEGIHVKYILDLRDFPNSPYADRVVHDVDIILNDPEISVVCETMGGVEPAHTFTKRALEKGISVCTSNKELVAAKGPELIRTAREHNCSYLFEASVGGGIPLLRVMNTSLSQEKLTRITGILNGTTNYILTGMESGDRSFDEMLKDAQGRGYAERNPEADIEGYDAARKIAILASLLTGKTVNYENVLREGISEISEADFAYARAMECGIKLLSDAFLDDAAEVHSVTAPFLVSRESPLFGVSGVFNAVLLHGNMVDDVMFYGRGAGKEATASAVVSDIIDCAKNRGSWIRVDWADDAAAMAPAGNDRRRFFVRVSASDEEKAYKVFGTDITRISAPGMVGEFAFVTAPVTEERFSGMASEIDIISRIRVY